MNKSEFQALVSLLDDPDTEVYEHVVQKMTALGEVIVPWLNDVWGHTVDKTIQDRIEHIIDSIRFNHISAEFEVWSKAETPDLLDGFTIINKFQYPFLDTLPFYNDYEQRAREIWLELNDNLTAFENINVFNKIIFDVWGFSAVTGKFQDRFEYNFISNMMELKCGNQFTLGSLYLILAEKLELPVRPVLLEDQLILAYIKPTYISGPITVNDIMFYINPHEKGVMFDSSAISKWIEQHGLEEKESYYLPISNKDLLRAYIKRLMSGYVAENEERKVQFLNTLFS